MFYNNQFSDIEVSIEKLPNAAASKIANLRKSNNKTSYTCHFVASWYGFYYFSNNYTIPAIMPDPSLATLEPYSLVDLGLGCAGLPCNVVLLQEVVTEEEQLVFS